MVGQDVRQHSYNTSVIGPCPGFVRHSYPDGSKHGPGRTVVGTPPPSARAPEKKHPLRPVFSSPMPRLALQQGSTRGGYRRYGGVRREIRR
jgi:hypothetical protein